MKSLNMKKQKQVIWGKNELQSVHLEVAIGVDPANGNNIAMVAFINKDGEVVKGTDLSTTIIIDTVRSSDLTGVLNGESLSDKIYTGEWEPRLKSTGGKATLYAMRIVSIYENKVNKFRFDDIGVIHISEPLTAIQS